MKNKNLYLRLLGEDKRIYFLTWFITLFITAEIILTVYIADLFKQGVDLGLARDENFKYVAVALISIIFLFSITIYFKDLLLGIISERAIAKIREKTVIKFTKLPLIKLDNMHSGENLSKLTNDIELIKRFIEWDGYFLILRPLMAVATLGYLLYLSWQLTLASVILTPIMMILTIVISRPITKYSKELQGELANINKVNQDILGGIEIVKAFNLRNRMLKEFAVKVQTAIKKGKLLALRRSGLMVVSIILNFMPFLITFGIGSYLVVEGKMTTGSLLAFINLLNQLTWPLSQLPNHYTSYKASLAGLERIYEIIDIPSEREDGEIFDTNSEEYVKFNGVFFSYSDKDKDEKNYVLKNLTFTIKKGEKVALVGPSGGGKSTIFKLITGFYSSNQGEIQIFGQPINKWNLSALRENIGVVSQDTFLFPTTIKENISLNRKGITMDDIVTAAKLANAHEFILNLPSGYETIVGERGSTLSGGQRQRISLARGIISDPALLLLDEATSALDSESEKLIQQALEKVMENKTAVIIAHRLSTIRNVDRIFVISEGEIVEEGNHDELLEKQGLYYRLYHKDFMDNGKLDKGVN